MTFLSLASDWQSLASRKEPVRGTPKVRVRVRVRAQDEEPVRGPPKLESVQMSNVSPTSSSETLHNFLLISRVISGHSANAALSVAIGM